MADAKQLFFDFSDFVEETAKPAAAPKPLPVIKPAASLFDEIPNSPPLSQTITFSPDDTFEPYGAWVDYNYRLSVDERRYINAQCVALLTKDPAILTAEEKITLKSYSGWGGTGVSDERGVLYDYYTSPPVARMTWRLLHKISPLFTGAKVLEPSCGTGVFFETSPEGLSLEGIELDKRTAEIASRIHPAIPISSQSYEQFNISGGKRKSYDFIIGNAPFGERSIETAFLDIREEKSLDRYFVQRSLDNLKPGGAMALITHPGVLANKTNEAWRFGIARKAQFVGAVKLNDHSFHHSHTEIQPDILFFVKHPEDIEQRLSSVSDEELTLAGFTKWLKAEDDYFGNHPNHVMGEISEGTGQWGSDEVRGKTGKEEIETMLGRFVPEEVFTTLYEEARKSYSLPEAGKEDALLYLSKEEQDAVTLKKLLQGAVKTVEDSVYLLDSSWAWRPVGKTPTLARHVEAVLLISGEVKAVRTAMREGKLADANQERAKEILAAYKNNYGTYPKDDPVIKKFVRENPSVRDIFDAFIEPETDILNVANLYDQNGKLVNGHSETITALFTLQEQLLSGTEENIKKCFPDTGDELILDMYTNPDVFLSPDLVWLLREDFISGNAWEKIDALETLASETTNEEVKKKWLYGKTELENAIGWVPIEDADFTPHASWIPEYIINQWITDEEGLNYTSLSSRGVISKNEEGKWGLKYTKDEITHDRKWNEVQIYEGEWREYADPVIYYLNMQKQRSRYYDTETYNKEHNDSFKNYIANHKEFRELLEKQYNRIFRNEIARPVKTYQVYLEGWREEEKTLRPHQWQSIHHLYRPGKGISALGTGFGKTLAGIGLHALLSQEGKIHRAWFQVPNNKVKDWVKEFHDVLPERKIGYVDPEMKGYSNRETRYALYQYLASSNHEILIMPESAASEIQLNPENDERITNEVISKHMEEKGEGRSERAKQNIVISEERKLENGKTNKTITFEDFGCDALFVDEAHRYKNLFSSSLSRETGLNDGRQSLKALALFKKSEYIRRNNDGKNVFLFTATPLTNSPLEYYNMLMYVAPEELEKFYIHTIDGFIKNFANIETAMTYDWKNGAVSSKRILTGFKNIQTLQNIFFKYTDYQNDPERINLIKPSAVNKPNIIPKNDLQTEVIKEISDELEEYINTPKDKRADKFPRQNFLTFYSRLRTASLDIELYDPNSYPDWSNPKLNKLSGNAWDIYSKTSAGQVVFSDRVFSGDLSFDLHEKIRSALTLSGFKAEEIIIVNGFTKGGGQKSDSAVEKEVSQAVAAFNAGKYKVLIGSTQCIGEGLNLQENSAALHHFDIPFRPSDFIQRNGRVDRQGNSQEEVELHTYLAAGTIDTYSVALVQRKANWIDKLLKTKSHVFVNPDDESFVDADELLLALTEEFGEKDKAQARREEMAKIQAQKIKEAEDEKRKEHLASLSMLRGALNSVSGSKNAIAYRNRLEKIENLEKALKANPSFKHQDFIDKKIPFLYAKNIDQIIQKGDALYIWGSPYEIAGLDFKKQSITVNRINTDSQGRSSELYYEDHDINKIKNICNGRYFSSLNGFNRELVENLIGAGFYTIEDTVFKEKNYLTHLECAHRNHDFTPVIFYPEKKNKITVSQSYYGNRDTDDPEHIPLNPFKEEDIKTITERISHGIHYEIPEWKEDYLETIKTSFPDIYRHIEKTHGKKQFEAAEYSTYTMNESKPYLDTFRENIIRLQKESVYSGDPLAAAKSILKGTNPEIRSHIEKELTALGCVNREKTKDIIFSWVNGRKERSEAVMEQGR